MMNRILLESNLRESFDISIMDTSRGEAGEGKGGSLAPINFLYFFRQLGQLLVILAVRRPTIVHQSITWGPAFWKETIFMLLCADVSA